MERVNETAVEKSVKVFDEIDDCLYAVAQMVAKKMGVNDLNNDEFTNEDVMEWRNSLLAQISRVKQHREGAFKIETTCLNCNHIQITTEESTYYDELGKFTVCEECKASYDYD